MNPISDPADPRAVHLYSTARLTNALSRAHDFDMVWAIEAELTRRDEGPSFPRRCSRCNAPGYGTQDQRCDHL